MDYSSCRPLEPNVSCGRPSGGLTSKARLWRPGGIDRKVAVVSLTLTGAALACYAKLHSRNAIDAADLLGCTVFALCFSALVMGVKSSAAWVSREHAGATWEPLVASGVAPRVVVIERVRLGLQRLAGLWMLPLPLWMVAASSGPPAVALLGLYALPCALIGILAGLICEPSTEPSTAPPSSPMAAATLLLVASLAAAGVLRHFGGVIVFDLTPFAVCRPLLTGASAQGLTLLAAQSVLLWILAGCSYRMAVAGLRRRMTRP